MSAQALTPQLSAGRWAIKKLARKSVALATRTAYAIGAPVSSRPCPCVRVLTYHRFGPSRRDPFCVSTEVFDRQMGWLATEGLAVSLDQVIAHVERREPLPAGSALVTIDDGYRSTLTGALPILQKYNVPAVAFLTSGRIDRQAEAQAEPGNEEPILTWEEARELCTGGVEIGSHALSHRSLAQMPTEQARQEAAESLARLEEETASTVRAFAYPFGTRVDYNESTAQCLRDAGYRCAFTSQHGGINPGADPMELPRVKVEGGEGCWMFRLLVHGGLDPWQFIDRTLWRWQQSSGA